MLDLIQRKTDGWALGVMLAFVGVGILGAVVLPGATPWIFFLLAVGAVMAYAAVRGHVAIWMWLWVLSFGMLDRWFWPIETPGFFTLSIPRLLFVAGACVFALHFMLRGGAVRMDKPVLWLAMLLTAYAAVSATIAGWTQPGTTHLTAPYFRFFAGILLPFGAMLLLYNAPARTEGQVKWPLILLTVYGFYALFVAYCQAATLQGWADLSGLIWPRYIVEGAEGMIHADRARGAFAGANPQANLLVFLFYLDWYLFRRVRGPYRWALVIQAALVPAALIFTGIRAGCLAFLLCGVVWCIWAGRSRFGWAKLAVAAVVLTVGVIANWDRVSSEDRRAGGMGQRGPVLARILLLQQTGAIVADRPVFGVGFGHFVEAREKLPYDPGSEAVGSSGTLVQHNVFLSMVSETGLVGLVLYVGVFAALFVRSLRIRRGLPNGNAYRSRDLTALFWVMLVNYLVAGMFVDVMADAFSNALMWTFAGVIVGLSWVVGPGRARVAAAGAEAA